MHLKMSSAKWRLFGLGLNELRTRSNVQPILMPCSFHVSSEPVQSFLRYGEICPWKIQVQGHGQIWLKFNQVITHLAIFHFRCDLINAPTIKEIWLLADTLAFRNSISFNKNLYFDFVVCWNLYPGTHMLHNCQPCTYRWLSSRLQFFHCLCTGDTAVLH